MALKLPKLHRTRKTEPSLAVVSGRRRFRLRRWQAVLFVLVFVGAGYVIVRSFAENYCDFEVCVVLPDRNVALSNNFHVRTRVSLAQDRDNYNIVVILDKYTSSEQVIDARRQSTKLARGTVKDYNFFYGSPKSSPVGDNLYFDRNLLTPGLHSITVEMRTGDIPGQGNYIVANAVNFTATAVRNLASSREPAKTFYAKNFPYSGVNSPRYGKVTPSTKSRVDKALAKVDEAVFPKASAHTGQHGNLVNTVYVDDPFDGSTTRDSRRGGVTVRAELYSRTDTNCHDSDNTNKVEYTNSQGHFMIRGETDNTQGTNHGMITFATCPVGGYNISIDVPDGFHIHPNSAATKQVQLADNENKSIEFTIQPNDDDGDRTPNYRDSCPRTAGYSTTYPGCPDIPPGCTYPAQQIPRPPANTRGPIYRYYSSAAGGFHYYSMERNDWGYVQGGLCFEGIEGYAYSNQVPGSVPLYHFYNTGNYDHFYTRNYAEGSNAGLQYSGVEGYVMNSNVEGTVPFQRYYSPCGNADHFYVASTAVSPPYCYNYEGIEGYVYTSGGTYVADRTYKPTQPPLLTLTSLSATTAEVDLFGFGWNRLGDPYRQVDWVNAKVDGVLTDSHSVTGYLPQSMASIITERVNLGNLADGKYHRVEIAAGNSYAPTILVFFVDPYGPYGDVLAANSSQERGSTYVEANESAVDTASLTIDVFEDLKEDGFKGDEGLIRVKVPIRIDSVLSSRECSYGTVPVTKTTSLENGYVRFTGCRVGRTAPKYSKTYYVYAEIPSGYDVDKYYHNANQTKKIYNTKTGKYELRLKVKLNKGDNRFINILFVKRSSIQFAALPETEFVRSFEDKIVDRLNAVRANNKDADGNPNPLPALANSDNLRSLSRAHSLDMYKSNFFAHKSRNGCADHIERLKRAGLYDYVGSAAENLIWFTPPQTEELAAQQAVDGWMGSKLHRDNILNPLFRFVGMGGVSRTGTSWTPRSRTLSNGQELCEFAPSPTPVSNFYIATTVFTENDPDPD